MSILLTELLTALNEAGLTLRREGEEIAIVGDLAQVTDAMRKAVEVNRSALIACLPDPKVEAAKKANSIREMLDAWATEFASNPRWTRLTQEYVEDIDRRLMAAVDTQQPANLARVIIAVRNELDSYAWAAEVFPWAFQTEAKHAAEADAGPAQRNAEDGHYSGFGNDVPF